MNPMNNQKAMLQQIQKMQQVLTKKLNEFNVTLFEYNYNNYVTVKMYGSLIVEDVIINPDIVDKDDLDTMQDILVKALNDATGQTLEKKEAIMAAATPGGLGTLGGLGGLL